VSTLFTPTNQYRVVMEVLPESAAHPDSLDRIYVRPPGGNPLPITTFLSFKPTSTLLSVNHQGQFPAVTLSFNLAPGVALGQAVQAIHKAEAQIGLPAAARRASRARARCSRRWLPARRASFRPRRTR